MSSAMRRIGNAGSTTGDRATAHAGRSRRATRGRPARSGITETRHPGNADAASPTIASPWSAPISSRAAPSGASASGNRSSSRPITASPSGPPSSATTGSNEVAIGKSSERIGADVGQVREDEVVRVDDHRWQQIGLEERELVGDGLADGVLTGELEGVGRTVRGDHGDLGGRPSSSDRHDQGDGDGAGTRADIEDPDRWRPDRAGRRRETPHHLGLCQLHQALGLRPRDERSRVDREGEPVELLESPDVGDRLARGTPCQARPVGRLSVRSHRRVGVRHDRGPIHADGMSEQQLGIETRGLGAAGLETLDPLAQQFPDLGHGRDAAIRAGS